VWELGRDIGGFVWELGAISAALCGSYGGDIGCFVLKLGGISVAFVGARGDIGGFVWELGWEYWWLCVGARVPISLAFCGS
jgi:hypothetical protein